MNNILEIKHITKKFGKKTVLNDLCLSVQEHSVFGFIGQNGAGKTTTMKIILGLLPFDDGEVFVNGEKVNFGQNTTNRYIGYLPDVPEFYNFMTPKEYLAMCGNITGMPKCEIQSRSDELLSLVGLEKENRRIKGFSRGMKQRLGIAQALLNSPRLLICDEPTSALDPVGRREILNILSAVREHTTVMFSTHILSDVERICDHIAFLYKGSAALTGTLEQVKHMEKYGNIEIEFYDKNNADRFSELNILSERITDTKTVLPAKSENDILIVMETLTQNKISILRIERLEPTLEDLFMEVMGK